MTKVGSRVPLIDAVEKVTGSLKYGSDFTLPGMLCGKVLRSPLPHARIVSIDPQRARKLPGVRAVITGWEEELPIYSVAGEKYPDERLLARGKVRYIGDEIAAVAATDEATAREALKRIGVEYEELPGVFDPVDAMREEAPRVHENIRQNIARTIQIRHGDVDSAFRESCAVVEGTFKTPLVHQSYLEPHCALAEWDFQGRVTLWIPTQSPTLARITYANALGISRDKIRIIQMPTGGAFGGKLEYKLHPLCALLARRANAPVKMTNTREEEFTASLPRVPMIIRMKAGCRKDGTLLVKQAEIIADSGAYLNYGPGILLSATTRHDNLYRLENIRTDSYLVYTNKVPTGCFRGFGCPQSFFAFESVIDMLADAIRMDPADFRLKNARRAGDMTPHKWYLGSCGLSEAIERSTEQAGWYSKRKQLPAKGSQDTAYGIGLACCLHVSGNRSFLPFFDGASATVRIDEEGYVIVHVGEPDIGQGSKTTFALIAAHELGIPIEWVKVAPVDTDISPHGLGTFGDRSTTLAGNAVRNAAMEARKMLLGAAARKFEASPAALSIEEGVIRSSHAPSARMEFKEAAQLVSYERGGATVTGHGQFIPANVSMVDPETKAGNISCAYPFVAQIAEVEVNLKSGRMKVLSLTAAHDLGKTLNPLLAEGQVQGAVAQGIGFSLMEEMTLKGGRVTNPNFKGYIVPRAKDIPPIRTIFVESNDPNGPYGAKGLAEPALTPIAPAIANAVYHATGVRVTELPITPEKLKNALHARASREKR
jgi:CO/xanthine dehydrogenase Mo-binding subunit